MACPGGRRDHFTIDYIENTKPINDTFLSHYQLFIQLNYPPYNWTPTAVAAFQRYIEEGRGGWIGFHHATLLDTSTDLVSGRGFPTLWVASSSRTTSLPSLPAQFTWRTRITPR